MSIARIAAVILVTALLIQAPLAHAVSGEPPAGKPAPDEATTAPATTAVPDGIIRQIQSQFALPRQPASQAEAIKMLTTRMERLLEMGADAERKYPAAGNLHLVRIDMLRAAHFLSMHKQNDASHKRLLDISNRILASSDPVGIKASADYFVTLAKVRPGGSVLPAKATDEIRAYVARYANTDTAALAAARATGLAEAANQPKLKDELIQTIESKYIDDVAGRAFLRRLGRHPDVGRPFVATLTRLDGTKLTLPEDLLGKVVVIDFWATWCPPCVASIPHMKAIYARHRPQGLEIVGISLDESRSKAKGFVTEHGLNWVHAFSGKGWADPTTRQYDIRAIPSIWVIGRDGKVLSDSARSALEQIIEKALKAPAP